MDDGNDLSDGSVATPLATQNDSSSQDEQESVTSLSSVENHRKKNGAQILDDAHFSEEAERFLSNIDNYLALGCLCFEDFAVRHNNEDDTWREIEHVPYLLGSDGPVRTGVPQLVSARWIRLLCRRSTSDPRYLIYRVYLLPGDVGHRYIDRQNRRLITALEALVQAVDTLPASWAGQYAGAEPTSFDLWATPDTGSLFYMFNKLPSPSPSAKAVKGKYAREALEDLLDPGSVLPGLKTVLYPYQRRSAGVMLQRESVSRLDLDPRLEQRCAPDGSVFYYGARDQVFLRHPRFYEACRGGILAETMGLGKTVICIATILATKQHLPKVPAPYRFPPTRTTIGSLAQMAVSAVNRKSIPWKVEFDRVKQASGEDMSGCAAILEQNLPFYEIPIEPSRWNRKTTLPPPRRLMLASTTLIVVPRNLCSQWQSELRKHVYDGTLKILVMEDLKEALPPATELRSYDVVLFSRNRFELEIKDGADDQGRRIGQTAPTCRCPYIGATRRRDCHCVRDDQLYDSPLKHLHFLRLIIDEGHFFSATTTNAVAVAKKLVKADHRWVVSGTPAKDLLGVEIDTSALESLADLSELKSVRQSIMEQRKDFSSKEDTGSNQAVKSLGALASNFLRIKPWYSSDPADKLAVWEEYIYRHEDARRRTYSGFSTCLRRTLEAMVVKTQPEDVERDIELPPLVHRVVTLEPSLYDKLTANLFTLVLTANAITSERTDADYLFHRNSQKARYQLIYNLRQSAFFWTGFSEADVLASLKNSEGYLEKDGTGCSIEDRQLLTETLACAHTILSSSGWKALSSSHELGLFVDQWPGESAEFWAFDESRTPMLTGVSQLLEAQKHVNERFADDDPGEGLGGAGIRAMAALRAEAAESTASSPRDKGPILTKSGIPSSSINGEPILRRRVSLTSKAPPKSPGPGKVAQSKTIKKAQPTVKHHFNVVKPQQDHIKTQPSLVKSAKRHFDEICDMHATFSKKRRLEKGAQDLAPSCRSSYVETNVIGTTSAKLSYLVSQILRYYKDEKILVFYDGDNVAYYIAQMLELLHIKHEIYAKSLAAALKSEYVVRFDQEAQDRVLLMDVKQAAFGLNLSSASRIYFVNPVCRPNVEAQAIKRAHRIGQTKKVVVETLVLRGTIEEKMLERAKRMTRTEHLDAKVLEDDGGIRKIIQSARILPVADDQTQGYGQVARLEQPQQLWYRPGWSDAVGGEAARNARARRRRVTIHDVTDLTDSGRLVDVEDEPAACSTRVKRRRVTVRDITEHTDPGKLVDADDEPAASLDLTEFGRPVAGTSGFRSSHGPMLPRMGAGSPSGSSVDVDPGSPSDKRLTIRHLLNDSA